MPNNNINGFLLINKPINFSSYDCIRVIKKIFRKQFQSNQLIPRIGHTGTLDNFANGLLIIAIGRKATKEINSFMSLNKEYIFKAKLGELTDTLDNTGKITDTKKIIISKDKLQKAINSVQGNHIQTPPIYSALKYKGSNLYKLAREKIVSKKELLAIIETKKRSVTIHNIELLNYKPPFFIVKAAVSKGTYIRSLANNIANRVNNVATCYELQRTKIGPINLNKTIKLDDLHQIKDILDNLIEVNILKNKLIDTNSFIKKQG